MEEIIIYEKPTCSKCRAAVSLVGANGRPSRRVRYYEEKLSKKKLSELVERLGIAPDKLVRTKESLYKELGLDISSMTSEAIISVLVEHPDLLERPILECGDKAVVGRSAEKVVAFLKELNSPQVS